VGRRPESRFRRRRLFAWRDIITELRVCDTDDRCFTELGPSDTVGSRVTSYEYDITGMTVVIWLSGSALVSINVVILRRARLILGWATVCG